VVLVVALLVVAGVGATAIVRGRDHPPGAPPSDEVQTPAMQVEQFARGSGVDCDRYPAVCRPPSAATQQIEIVYDGQQLPSGLIDRWLAAAWIDRVGNAIATGEDLGALHPDRAIADSAIAQTIFLRALADYAENVLHYVPTQQELRALAVAQADRYEPPREGEAAKTPLTTAPADVVDKRLNDPRMREAYAAVVKMDHAMTALTKDHLSNPTERRNALRVFLRKALDEHRVSVTIGPAAPTGSVALAPNGSAVRVVVSPEEIVVSLQ